MTLTVKQLQQTTKERDSQWDPDNKLTLSFRATELAGETGEACNIIKKLERERLGLRGSRATKEQLAEEIGDVLICLALLANSAEIDLEKAVIDKFNASSIKLNLDARL
jgi:NTP pyrophosphatase (non-canonical NTP hydrolase)